MFIEIVLSIMLSIVFVIGCWIIAVDIYDRKQKPISTDCSDCKIVSLDLDTISECVKVLDEDLVHLSERVADLEATVDILVLGEDICYGYSDDTE